jgi:hypothetical protein
MDIRTIVGLVNPKTSTNQFLTSSPIKSPNTTNNISSSSSIYYDINSHMSTDVFFHPINNLIDQNLINKKRKKVLDRIKSGNTIKKCSSHSQTAQLLIKTLDKQRESHRKNNKSVSSVNTTHQNNEVMFQLINKQQKLIHDLNEENLLLNKQSDKNLNQIKSLKSQNSQLIEQNASLKNQLLLSQTHGAKAMKQLKIIKHKQSIK